MKLPPSNSPPEKAPTYDKDRTLTRRTVKGAGGGMLGVDYQEDPKGPTGPTTNRKGRPVEGDTQSIAQEYRSAVTGERGQGSETSSTGAPLVTDPSRIIQDDELGVQTAYAQANRRFRRVARDRMNVDKDAPELVRKRRPEDELEDEREQSSEQVIEIYGGDLLDSGAHSTSRAHLFAASDEAQPGDLSLTDPEDMQRALKTPVAYARHSMILSEAFRKTTGATREEGVAYLGRLFVALKDKSFARNALKEFGAGSGILDLYPLEVVEHILDHYPTFLPKVGFGRFFRRVAEEASVLHTDTATPLILTYPEELKIRGFALRGGGRPGYLFEPADQLGSYRLAIDSPGKFSFLISSLSRTGHTMIERLDVVVRAAPGAKIPPRIEEPVIERNPERIAAWPIPAPPSIDLRDALWDSDAAREKKRSERLEHLRLQDVVKRREVSLEVDESDSPIAPCSAEEPAREPAAPEPVAKSASTSASQPASQPATPAAAHAAPAPAPAEPAAPRAVPPPAKTGAGPRARAPSLSSPIRRPAASRRAAPPKAASEDPRSTGALAALADVAAKLAAAPQPIVAPPTMPSEPPPAEDPDPTEAFVLDLPAELAPDTDSIAAASPLEPATSPIRVGDPSRGFADAEPVDRTQPIRVRRQVEDDEPVLEDPDPTIAGSSE